MGGPGLEAFHATSRKLDFVRPMESLLDEFRRGNIADKDRVQEASAIRSHLGEHYEAWDRVFPRFPECPWRRRTITWENHRGRRDAYLERLIVTYVPQHEPGDRLIVNPATVAGMRGCPILFEEKGGGRTLRQQRGQRSTSRQQVHPPPFATRRMGHPLIINPATVAGMHARRLAHKLPAFEVLGTDIDPRWDRLYQVVLFWKHCQTRNYRFVKENIFDPNLERHPAAVVFFGACGSVTDGCMDYAIALNSPFLICRSCCHDNIGGNTQIVRRRGRPINDFFAWKNYWIAKHKRKGKGFYFSDRYRKDAYPRSEVARGIMDTIRSLSLSGYRVPRTTTSDSSAALHASMRETTTPFQKN